MDKTVRQVKCFKFVKQRTKACVSQKLVCHKVDFVYIVVTWQTEQCFGILLKYLNITLSLQTNGTYIYIFLGFT